MLLAQPIASVLLDTSADAAAAAAAAAAGGSILVTRGWYHLHPAAALAIAVVVPVHLTRAIVGHLLHNARSGAASQT